MKQASDQTFMIKHHTNNLNAVYILQTIKHLILLCVKHSFTLLKQKQLKPFPVKEVICPTSHTGTTGKKAPAPCDPARKKKGKENEWIDECCNLKQIPPPFSLHCSRDRLLH